MSEPTPLDYAPPPRRRRRRGRIAIAAALLLLVGSGVYWRESLAHHVRLWNVQRQCLNYTRPPGTRVMTTQPTGGDYDYRRVPQSWSLGSPPPPLSVLTPACWGQFEAERRDFKAVPQQAYPQAVFLHERVSPAGHRRLVYVESVIPNALQLLRFHNARVIDPAAPWGEPRELSPQRLFQASGRYVEADLFFGQPDPADPSHFTIDFTAEGRRGTIDGWLRDDDTVQFKLRDEATTRRL